MADALTGFNVHWIVADDSTKLLTAIAAGTPPAVAVGNAPYAEFWARGAAQPLDAYIAKSKVITRTDIPAPYWSLSSYKGKTYGVTEVEVGPRYGLVLDMTNLQKYGINPTTFSWDWDTLTKLQQETTVKAANGSIRVLGIDPLDATGGAFGGAISLSWGLAWKLQYYDEATHTFQVDTEQFIEALTVLKKAYDIAGGARAIAGFHSSYGTWTESPTAAMPAGVENANIDGYYAPGELAHSSPHRAFAYTWAPVPASERASRSRCSVGTRVSFPVAPRTRMMLSRSLNSSPATLLPPRSSLVPAGCAHGNRSSKHLTSRRIADWTSTSRR
jgi:ABC-type glycerol-3-phosphate transport system substrate-binding protein